MVSQLLKSDIIAIGQFFIVLISHSLSVRLTTWSLILERVSEFFCRHIFPLVSLHLHLALAFVVTAYLSRLKFYTHLNVDTSL